MDFKNHVAFKRTLFLIGFSFTLFFAFHANADYTTTLLPGVYIQNNGVDLDAGLYSAPTVYDWDNDGSKDLVIGRKGAGEIGYVSFYKNYGTDAAPSFSGYTDIQTCTDPCSNAGGG